MSVLDNVLETSASLATHFKVDARTIKRDVAAMQKMGVLVREGNTSAGHWVVIKEKE